MIFFPQIQVILGKHSLLEIEIEIGDSLSITQKPYTLPLKHTTWVQRELEILEKAGVIVRSVSPWASPIVVVPNDLLQGNPLNKGYVLTIEPLIVYYLLSRKPSPRQKAF